MLKYWLILIASIGIVGYSSYAALFFGWATQSTNDQAMAQRAKWLTDIWSFVFLVALVAAVVCIARLIQLRRRRKPAAQSL